MQVLAQLSHPFVLQFIGLCFKDDCACIVAEWCSSTLLRWLLGHDCRRNGKHAAEAQHLALQVAQGMRYLHAQSIVHLDLKPSNVLITGNGVPKIADYGLSRLLLDQSRQSRRDSEVKRAVFVLQKNRSAICFYVRPHFPFDESVIFFFEMYFHPTQVLWLGGSPAYMSPEALSGTFLPSKLPMCDVYSSGMVLWAMYCGEPAACPDFGRAGVVVVLFEVKKTYCFCCV